MMTSSHNTIYCQCEERDDIATKPPRQRLKSRLKVASSLVLLFLFISSPVSVLSFKAGHVEPVPGSSVGRKGSPSSFTSPTGTSDSRSQILMKLSSSRSTNPQNFYGQSARDSTESVEHEQIPFVKFPTFGQSGETTKAHEDLHPHHHHDHNDHDDHQVKHTNGNHHQHHHHRHHHSQKSALPAREEPSSLFAEDDGPFDSYYTTGSDATQPSSIDIDRYSQETDLFAKQSATPIKSSPVASSSSSEGRTNKSRNRNNSLEETNNANSTSQQTPSSLSKPTLLPANYLSFGAFRHIDGTLEKSSSSIISRIASFWRNMNKNSTINSSSSLGGGSGGNTNHRHDVVEDDDDDGAYSKQIADTSSGIDAKESNDKDKGDVLVKNDSRADITRPRTRESSSIVPLHPSKFVSDEEMSDKVATTSTSGGGFPSGKHQYLHLDDGEEELEDEGNTSGYDVDHHLQPGGSLEENLSDSHTFHDDLFHTTGTITATFSEGDSHQLQDLMGSSTSTEQHQTLTGNSRETTGTTTSSTPTSLAKKGDVKRAESDKIWSINSHFGRNELIESAEEEHEYYGMTIGGFLKRELWTIPLFVLAALNMILIILFEVYVLCRARGQSRRHLFLGQMLLFGLFLCSFLALMFAVHPSIIGCFVGRLGVGITYSLIFSVLMVKCVFLLSLDTGVYLPTSYQGILLFFAVLVQVAVDTQWVIMYPPFLQTVETGRSILLQCGTSYVQLLYSLSYVAFLILIVGLLAGRAAYKGVVENYRESVYILITAVVTVPVALSWTVAGWMLQGRHQDACVSFGLVAHSLTTFLIMFMPKGRQLASLDKEGVCFEDQEDQCSGYSPSFFHFKPTTKNYKTALWGDGNLYTTLEPTVSTINPNVFFHRNDFHSGMIY